MKYLLSVLIVALGFLMYYDSKCILEEVEVYGTVYKKEHIEEFRKTTLMSTGKSVIPISRTIPEEFNVFVKYEDLLCEYNSEALFSSIEKGDSIKIILVNKYSPKGEFITRYIR